MSHNINNLISNNVGIIKDYYRNNVPESKSDYFSLVTSPFKVLKLKNLFSTESFSKELFNALSRVELTKKDNDLYCLWQSADLHNSAAKPIKKFIRILNEEIGPLLMDVCNVKFNGKISITASLYNFGDVLLCHDDKCDDRCIAFVYYLTGSENSGGTFDMFGHNDNLQPTDILHSIPPVEDSFICFEVGNTTYHQVSEVLDPTFQRWSINGWFHSDRCLPDLDYEEPPPRLLNQLLHEGLLFLDEYFNPIYCTPSNLRLMNDCFEKDSFICLKNLLNKQFIKSCSSELTSTSIIWKKVGPVNRRNFYEADLHNLTGAVSSLIKLFMSPLLISFLKNITSLSLEPSNGGATESSEFILQLIRWSGGCYTMATDNDPFFRRPGLDLYLFLDPSAAVAGGLTAPAENSSGFVTYLDTMATTTTEVNDEDTETPVGTGTVIPMAISLPLRHATIAASDIKLLTIEPEDNALALVYRTDHTVRFTKYINKFIKKEYYAIYATYYEIDDAA